MVYEMWVKTRDLRGAAGNRQQAIGFSCKKYNPLFYRLLLQVKKSSRLIVRIFEVCHNLHGSLKKLNNDKPA